MDAAAEAGYDMYLAGHTHTGQMFPNRLVTQRMYKLDYGLARFGDLTAVVSNGYGFLGTAGADGAETGNSCYKFTGEINKKPSAQPKVFLFVFKGFLHVLID